MTFLTVAFVSGTMAARLREHAEASRQRAQTTEALFDFSAKLSAATGPAGRRHLMVRALGAFTDDASRAKLVAAVAAIDLAPTYAKLAKARSLEERARVLAETIARVTADNLPELVQDHELRELESKLNSLA